MNRHAGIKLLFLAVFLLASSMRLALAIVNREANDPHTEVVNSLLVQKSLPDAEDCRECFHPKLYYLTAAAVIQVADIDRPNSRVMAAQLINVLAGEALLLAAYWLLMRLPIRDDRARLLSFSLLALNPKLIVINAQASNDTFVFLFSSLAVLLFWVYLQGSRTGPLLVSALFVLLAIASKTNGWCVAIAIFFSLLIHNFAEKRRGGAWAAALFIAGVAAASFLNPLTQYWHNTARYGTPVFDEVAAEQGAADKTLGSDPLPHFITRTYLRRPGIVSIADGLFTFKLFSLLEHPRQVHDPFQYPAFRTSLWTVLYAGAHSAHFDNWPASWHTRPFFEVTRAIYVVALLPTAILLAGAWHGGAALLRGLLTSSQQILRAGDYGLFELVFAACIAFAAVFSLAYRDYSAMKAIYIYPGILAFMVLFCRTLDSAYTFFAARSRVPALLFQIGVLFLLGLYSFDVISMVQHLYVLNVS